MATWRRGSNRHLPTERSLSPRRRPSVSQWFASAGSPAVRAAARRPPRQSEHRRLHHWVPRKPARRVRSRCDGRRQARRQRRVEDGVPAGHERRTRRHGGDGDAARGNCRHVSLRRCYRSLVRKGTWARSGKRRIASRRVRRHLLEGRRAGAGGRRPDGEKQHVAQQQRRNARRPQHADHLSRRCARSDRSWPPCDRVVARVWRVGQHQGCRGSRRRYRFGRTASRAHQADRAHDAGRRQAVGATPQRRDHHSVHRRAGKGIPRGAAEVGQRIRRAQPSQHDSCSRPQRLDRHRGEWPHLSRNA